MFKKNKFEDAKDLKKNAVINFYVFMMRGHSNPDVNLYYNSISIYNQATKEADVPGDYDIAKTKMLKFCGARHNDYTGFWEETFVVLGTRILLYIRYDKKELKMPKTPTAISAPQASPVISKHSQIPGQLKLF